MTSNYSIFFILLIFCVKNSFNLLLYPQFSVLQITSAFSVPVEIPKRKFFFDWGFQMNYNLPFNVSNFYNVPIWSRQRKRSINYDDNVNNEIFQKYSPNLRTHHYDMTAGEFYGIFEDLLISFGYHETCLLKSVCYLAKHPFDLKGKKSLLSEIIHFIMTPSSHQAFADDETHYKDAYETAEFYGKIGNDCNILYPDCSSCFLDTITKVVF